MRPKISIFIIAYIVFISLSSLLYSQNSYPIFNGSPTNMPQDLKLQDLKLRTQDFISKNLDQAFIQKHLPVGDTIQFNIQYTVGIEGEVNPDKIFINTEIDFFNLKIKSVLVKLPKFIPAKSIFNDTPKDFTLNFTPEFYINQLSKLVPIYRYDLSNVLIYTKADETDLIKAADSLGYNFKSNSSISNLVYFTTNDNKEIVDIRITTEHILFSERIKAYILNLEQNENDIFQKLHKNTNYILSVYLFIMNTYTTETGIEIVVIYPGCENKKDNKSKRKCMNDKLTKHVSKYFNVRLLNNKGFSGKQQIRVFFNIDINGNVIDIKARAPHPSLEKEIKRVINLLPKMKPGYQDDKPVVVSYYLPVAFEIQKGKIRETTSPFRNERDPFNRNN